MQKLLIIILSFIAISKTYGQTYSGKNNIDRFDFEERAPKNVSTKNGREALYLNGKAFMKDVQLTDGIIEVDIMAATERCFAGLIFRAQDRHNYEALYLRMHKSDMPDAVQYNPEFNGEANWQLYREHQAMTSFDPFNWNHLKIEIKGSALSVFLNDHTSPILSVENLRMPNEPGSIGFYSFLGSYFTNFRYTKFQKSATSSPSPEYASGVVKEWELSPSMAHKDVDTHRYPGKKALDDINWITGVTEPSGLLPINKYRKKIIAGKFEKNQNEVLWARHTFNSDRAERKKLYFDFSDHIDLYFNGELLYSGKNGFRFKGPTHRGDIHIEGNAVYLEVKEGTNEILCAVADKANGWGILAKFDE